MSFGQLGVQREQQNTRESSSTIGTRTVLRVSVPHSWQGAGFMFSYSLSPVFLFAYEVILTLSFAGYLPQTVESL